jgi:hypothetical protein
MEKIRYGWERIDGKLVPVPEEQEVIKAALALKGKRGMCAVLNAAGYRDRDGSKWSKDKLRKLYGKKRRAI